MEMRKQPCDDDPRSPARLTYAGRGDVHGHLRLEHVLKIRTVYLTADGVIVSGDEQVPGGRRRPSGSAPPSSGFLAHNTERLVSRS